MLSNRIWWSRTDKGLYPVIPNNLLPCVIWIEWMIYLRLLFDEYFVHDIYAWYDGWKIFLDDEEKAYLICFTQL